MIRIVYLPIVFLILFSSCTDEGMEQEIEEFNDMNKVKFEYGSQTFIYDEACSSYLDSLFHEIGIATSDYNIVDVFEFEPSVELANMNIAQSQEGIFLNVTYVNQKLSDTVVQALFRYSNSDTFIPIYYDNFKIIIDPTTIFILNLRDTKLNCGSQFYGDSIENNFGVWEQMTEEELSED